MKLSEILKQFKTIEPGAEFTERSKREILLTPHTERRIGRGLFAFLQILETSAAVVLAGFFILILTGTLSNQNAIEPIQYSVIDPTGLQAEAQAVDMQIQLANIKYPQTTSTAESTIATSTIIRNAFAAPAIAAPTSSDEVQAPEASTTTSSSVSIDQALQTLSQ